MCGQLERWQNFVLKKEVSRSPEIILWAFEVVFFETFFFFSLEIFHG